MALKHFWFDDHFCVTKWTTTPQSNNSLLSVENVRNCRRFATMIDVLFVLWFIWPRVGCMCMFYCWPNSEFHPLWWSVLLLRLIQRLKVIGKGILSFWTLFHESYAFRNWNASVRINFNSLFFSLFGFIYI